MCGAVHGGARLLGAGGGPAFCWNNRAHAPRTNMPILYFMNSQGICTEPPLTYTWRCRAQCCRAECRAAVLLVLLFTSWMHPTARREDSASCRAVLVAVVLVLAVLCDVVSGFIAPAAVRGFAPSSSRIMSSTSSGGASTECKAKNQCPSLPASVKGILFDMDGTLTDSDTLHFEAYRETFLKVWYTLQKGSYDEQYNARCVCCVLYLQQSDSEGNGRTSTTAAVPLPLPLPSSNLESFV